MNHRQVEAFQAVMETGSVSKAGKVLYISQPAVSRLISDLESNVGFKLFFRRKGRLEPTVEGRRLFETVEHAFLGLRKIEQTATAIKSLRTGELRIITMPGVATMLLPPILTRYCRQYPDISLEVENRPRLQVMDWLNSQQYDLGIANLPLEVDDVRVHSTVAMDLVCVLPVGHRLAKKTLIKASDFEGESFVSYSPNTGTRMYIDQYFQQAKVNRKLKMEFRNTHEIYPMVAAESGLSILLPFHKYIELGYNLVFRPLENAIKTELALLIPEKREPSMATKRVFEIYHEFMAEHESNQFI
ncbi:MAG TPA: LysR family transcriptional regulator [Deltaproteobacteria bacterium]|nr:LysR family transcriptional regulator [Deltaproteobacteria bacterium]